MRLIDAEALKKEFCKDIMGGLNWESIIENAPIVQPKYFPPCEDCNKKMEEIRQAYDKMKAMERPHDKWIPVSERLPDLYEVVLVTDETGYVFEYERRISDDEGNVCEEWSFLGRKIIAWMPLPEPYRKEGAE